MLAVKADGITKTYKNGVKALDSINIEVNEGNVFGLLGPNGAGKTTLTRILAGMISQTGGIAYVAGIDTRKSEKLHEQIGLLTETPGFYERMSAIDNLSFFANFYNVNVKRQVEKYLRLVELWEKKDSAVGTFSKGMKQRLAIARALIHEPRIVFMDEPTSGLDPEMASEIRELILSLKNEGRTIFLCTHNLGEAEKICDEVAILKTEILAVNSPSNLKENISGKKTIVELDFINDDIIRSIKSLDFVKDFLINGKQITITIANAEQNKPELLKYIVYAGARVQFFGERENSLEEVYFKIMNEEGERR